MKYNNDELFITYLMIRSLIFLILMGLMMTSCYYDSEEYLYPQSAICDTSNVLYSNSIKPVIDAYCVSCHSGGTPSGSISLENYDQIKPHALDGHLLDALYGTGGAQQMPPGGSLSPCNLAKFRIWITAGAPKN
jgi:hypothetical protein